jgi:Tfp pilus assembly protein PilN
VRPLNLATEPFRNERVPILAAGLLALLAAGVTVAHAVTLSHLMPSHLREAEAKVDALETELGRLQTERARLRDLKPDKTDLERWSIVRELVDRRVFRWNALFVRLRQLMPTGIRLSALEPVIQDDGVEVRLTAIASPGGSRALLDLVRRIEDQPDFENAAPETLIEDDKGDTLVLRVRYRPTSPGEPRKPGAQPTPQTSATPEARS